MSARWLAATPMEAKAKQDLIWYSMALPDAEPLPMPAPVSAEAARASSRMDCIRIWPRLSSDSASSNTTGRASDLRR